MTTVVEFTMLSSCLLGVGRHSGTVLWCWCGLCPDFTLCKITVFFCHLDKSWGDLGRGTAVEKMFLRRSPVANL